MPSYTHKIETTRLILRSICPSEASQLRTIRSDPKNNDFDAIPNPRTRERSLALGISYATQQGVIDLFVILKPSHFWSDMGNDDKYKSLVVDEGLAIGVMQICPPDTENGEKGSEVGGYIHHEFVRRGYGKEAFEVTIHYALEPLMREEVILETKKGNLGLRGVMRSLGLEGLERTGKAWQKEKQESVRWEVGQREWNVNHIHL